MIQNKLNQAICDSDSITTTHIDNGSRGTPNFMVSLERTMGIAPIVHKALSYAIVGAAIEVHRRIGPGLLESAYQRSLESELRYRGIPFVAQAPITFTYRGDDVGEYLADFIVDDKVIVESKSVERYLPVHRSQLYSYLTASNLNLGLLINFNAPVLAREIRRVVRWS